MTTLKYSGELTVVVCWCGTRHAVPSELHDFQRRQHRDGVSDRDIQNIYCPLGHIHIPAGEGDAAKLRRELEQERQKAAQRLAQLDQERAERGAVERSLIATKGQVTKLRKRAQGGACPCCKRTFVQLARHVASKHPGFEPESFT